MNHFYQKKNEISSFDKNKNFKDLILDFLMYSDGKNELNKIAELINLDYLSAKKLYNFLKINKLLKY